VGPGHHAACGESRCWLPWWSPLRMHQGDHEPSSGTVAERTAADEHGLLGPLEARVLEHLPRGRAGRSDRFESLRGDYGQAGPL
jgi:hypothetical protein